MGQAICFETVILVLHALISDLMTSTCSWHLHRCFNLSCLISCLLRDHVGVHRLTTPSLSYYFYWTLFNHVSRFNTEKAHSDFRHNMFIYAHSSLILPKVFVLPKANTIWDCACPRSLVWQSGALNAHHPPPDDCAINKCSAFIKQTNKQTNKHTWKYKHLNVI